MRNRWIVCLLCTLINCGVPRAATNDVAINRIGSGDRLIVLLGGSEGGFLDVDPLTQDLINAG